jgi:restriction system protein
MAQAPKRPADRRTADPQRQRWEAAERKRAASEAERLRKLEEKQRQEAELQRQVDLASEQTAKAERRLSEVTGILAGVLDRSVRPLDFEALKKTLVLPLLDLGVDAEREPAPQWDDYAPPAPGAIGRAFGGANRYASRRADAEERFEHAQRDHADREIARQQRVVAARVAHVEHTTKQRQHVEAQQAKIDTFQEKVLNGDRLAVSEYYQRIIDGIAMPSGFPAARRAAYVPESTELVIEWDIPGLGIVSPEKEFQFVKTRKAIEVRKKWTVDEIRGAYQNIICQVALQAVHVAFAADPNDLVDTVVVNGMLDMIDPAIGQPIRPCRITLRAIRAQYDKVNLRQVKAVDCVRRYFGAEVTDHPDALTSVEPYLSFDMADPRLVDPIDILSKLDKRANLMDLTPKEFEHFIQNLFNQLGFDTKQFRASGDGGIDCIAYDPTPIRGGKYVIQVKHYKDTVQPSAVRDLFGVVHAEGATKGILITTSGFGPSSYEFANGKPLQLYDGTRLLWLCQQQGIEARIIMPSKARRKAK